MVDHEVTVTTRVSGVIESINADRGARVRKGQALATLDQREFRLDREAAEAAFNVAKADYARYQELWNLKLTSRAELEQRKARYEQARVDLEKAKLVIDRSVIRAPFDGVVADRSARVGEKVLLEDNTPLFRITALRPLTARVYLSARELERVSRGEIVSVRSIDFAHVTSTGHIEFVSPVVDPASDTIQLIARVEPDRAGLLRPGMAVQIVFPHASRDAVTLERDCLAPGPHPNGRAAVFMVDNGRLRRRVIQFLPAEGPQITVTSGLTEGDLVVVDPTSNLREGMAVTVER
jgi:membrane fusion protein, multidrug efflux system